MIDITLGIPVYNSAPFVDELFASLRRLSPAPAEIIFLDDASTDDSQSRVRNFIAECSGNVRLVCNESNLGIAGAYNRLVREASSEWVQLLDCDDLIVESDFFARVAECMRDDIDLVVASLRSNAGALNFCARTLAPFVPRQPPIWWPLLGSFATRAGVLYRRERLLALPFPDPAYPGSDIIHLLKLRSAGRCVYVRNATVFYRIHAHAQSSRARDYATYRSELLRWAPLVRHAHSLDLWMRQLGQWLAR